jgi:hypothetical protein
MRKLKRSLIRGFRWGSLPSEVALYNGKRLVYSPFWKV